MTIATSTDSPSVIVSTAQAEGVNPLLALAALEAAPGSSIDLRALATAEVQNPNSTPAQLLSAAGSSADPTTVESLLAQASQGQGPIPAALASAGVSQVQVMGFWQNIWHWLQTSPYGIGKPGVAPGTVNPGSIPGDVGKAVSNAFSWSGLLPILLNAAFVVASLFLLSMGLSRVFPGVTTTVGRVVRPF